MLLPSDPLPPKWVRWITTTLMVPEIFGPFLEPIQTARPSFMGFGPMQVSFSDPGSELGSDTLSVTSQDSYLSDYTETE